MKLPKSVKVGPYTYAVRAEEKVIDHDGNASDGWGYCAYEKHYMTIRNNLSPDLQRVVFFHEALHAIGEASGAKLSERQVHILAPALTAFLLDNKLLSGDGE